MSGVLKYQTSTGEEKEYEYSIYDTTIDLSGLDIHIFDTSQLMDHDRLRDDDLRKY